MDRRVAEVSLRGERFHLLPERCAYREKDQMLIASDLHWGKPEVFQAHGIAMPSAVLDSDLRRLSFALNETGAERLLILGDLIHAPKGVTDLVAQKVNAWRARHPRVTFQVIRGNHDRKFPWPQGWGIEDIGTELRESDFLFTHDEPATEEGLFVWQGHVHPVVELRGGGDRLRLPCFLIEENHALLPAFSEFTGGANIGGHARDRQIFAIAEESVLEV